MSDSDLPVGSELFGYRVERLLSRGGMGVVYLCEDLRLRRRVALKLLTASLAQDDGFRERFLVEAHLAASLDHPHVVPIYEAGDGGGRLFIAMRYVEGSDLRALIRDGPLSAKRALGLCAQLADALDFAHDRGLVHGDVKPSNVLLDRRDHAYLADFGVTRRLEDPQRVEPGLLGTIDYVAPELIRGEQFDGRADEYSLGCLLYECLTGGPPFARSTNAAVLFAHLEEPPPAPPGMELVMQTALAKEPGDRYRTCGEFVAAVAEALGIDEHTEWGRRALEWDRHGRDRGFLLASAELEAAEHWRREAAGKEPAPTLLHGEFIDASREAVTRRLRRTRGFVSAALLVTVGLAVLAFVQRQVAVSNQRAAQSLQLAVSAEAMLGTDPELSTLLALQALRVRQTSQAAQALKDALLQLRVLATLHPQGGPPGSATFSPDGKEILIGSDGSAQIWSASSHRRLFVLTPPGFSPIVSTAFSPDGTEIVTASPFDGTVRIWSARSHQQLAVLIGPKRYSSSFRAVFSPDGKEILISGFTPRPGESGEWSVRILSASSHRQLFVLTTPGLNNPVNSTVFSPSGKEIVTTDLDGTARIWSTSRHRLVAVLRSLSNMAGTMSAAFSPRGNEIVTAADATAQIWSASTHRQLAVIAVPDGSALNDVAFSPDGKEIVTASASGIVRIWSAIDGKQLLVLAGHTGAVETANFSPNGLMLVTASQDGTVKLWNVGVLEQLALLIPPTPSFAHVIPGGLQSATFSPDGREIVTAGQDGNVRIWSARSHQQLAVLTKPGGLPVSSAEFSPDGRLIVTASADGSARVWSASSHRELAVLHKTHPPIPGQPTVALFPRMVSAVFSPDGKDIVTASVDGTVRIWSARSDRQLAVLHAPNDPQLSSVAFSSDGKEIVTEGTTGALIWGATSHRELAVIPEPSSGSDSSQPLGNQLSIGWCCSQFLASAAFSPDGKEIVTSSEGSARIWSASSHRQLFVLTTPGLNRPVNSTAFSPDGTEILTAGVDGTVRIWSATSRQQLAVFTAPDGAAVNRAAFSPDGKEIVTASADGSARVWSTELAGPLRAIERLAEKRVTRELTPSERETYLVGIR